MSLGGSWGLRPQRAFRSLLRRTYCGLLGPPVASWGAEIRRMLHNKMPSDMRSREAPGLWLPCPGKTDRMTGWWTGVHGVACTSIAFRHCLVQAFVHCVRIDASRRQAGKSMRNQTSFFSLNRMETPNGHVLPLRYNSCTAAKPTTRNVPLGRP